LTYSIHTSALSFSEKSGFLRHGLNHLQKLSLSVCLSFFLQTVLFSQDFTYKEKKEMAGYAEYISQAGFSPFRNWFVVCVGDNTLEIYDRNWKKMLSYQGNPKSFGGHFAFSPDEKFLAYARYKSDNDVAIFRMNDMKVIQVLQGHTGKVNKLCFSNNGRYLASCSSDNTVRLYQWEGDELVPLQIFDDQVANVLGISFSYDDRFLASCNQYKTVIIRELKNGKYLPFQKKEIVAGFLTDLAFHPLDYELVIGSNHNV
jgi:WD40 repeat protein